MTKVQLALALAMLCGGVTLAFLLLAFVENRVIRRNQKIVAGKKAA